MKLNFTCTKIVHLLFSRHLFVALQVSFSPHQINIKKRLASRDPIYIGLPCVRSSGRWYSLGIFLPAPACLVCFLYYFLENFSVSRYPLIIELPINNNLFVFLGRGIILDLEPSIGVFYNSFEFCRRSPQTSDGGGNPESTHLLVAEEYN